MADLTIPSRIAELVEQHGSLRAAARVLECDAGYLSRLQSGEKTDPGAHLLRRMGLRQVTTFERINSVRATQAAPAAASTKEEA